MSEQKKDCPSCGGSGQIQFFQGESRFLLTVEECPECSGTGYIQQESEPGCHRSGDNGGQQHKEK